MNNKKSYFNLILFRGYCKLRFCIIDLFLIIQYRIKVYISYNNFNQITTLNYDYKVIQK